MGKNRKTGQKRKFSTWIFASVLSAIVLAGILFSFRASRLASPISQAAHPETSQSPPKPPRRTDPPVSAREPAAVAPLPVAPPPRVAIRPDDGILLWESPVRGRPIELNFLPAGTQWVLYARPAAFLKLEGGPEIMRSLGIEPAVWVPSWQDSYGVSPDEVVWGRWTMNMSEAAELQTVALLCVSEPRREWKLQPVAPGSPIPREWQRCSDRSDRLIRLTPPVLILQGPPTLIEELAAAKEPGVLRRELETLRQATDDGYDFTLLGTPSYLFREGLVHVPKEWHTFLRGVEQVVPADSRACYGTVYLAHEEVFVECRAILGQDSQQSAGNRLSEAIDQIPERVTTLFQHRSIASVLGLGTEARALGLQIASMASFLRDQRRMSVRGRQAIIQWSLPPAILPHVLVATRAFLFAEEKLQNENLETVPRGLSAEELLRSQISIAIAGQPLESMVRELAEVINQKLQPDEIWDIRIDGKSFGEEGITRNQPIPDLKMDGQPLANVLTELAMRANPVQSARTPEALSQKVVWIIDVSTESKRTVPGGPVVWITTKRGAKSQGWKLPPIFEAE